jgi:hypothetical protein
VAVEGAMTDDNIDDPRSIYPPRVTGLLQSKAKRIKCLRVRRDALRSSIAVLGRGSEPPAAQLEALRTELVGVEDELRALGAEL